MVLSLNKFDLKDQYALITGSAGLLGYEHAAALLEVNANVILTDISSESLKKTYNQLKTIFPSANLNSYYMDVSKKESIIEVHKSLLSENKKVSILINNAAIDPKVTLGDKVKNSSRLEEFSEKDWNIQIDVGLKGAFLCSQIFGSDMKNNNIHGVILNIASDLSVLAPDQRLYKDDSIEEHMQPVKPVTYSVVKAGLVGLTKYLATYWAESNIRCNSLSPGGIKNEQSDIFIKRYSGLVPLGRMAEKNEYRSAVQFLCSEASSYMTGVNLVIDGGKHVW